MIDVRRTTLSRWFFGGTPTTTAIVTVGSLLGCESTKPDAQIVIDTLPNGGVRVVGPSEGTWAGRGPVNLVELQRLGAVDDAGEQTFGEVWDVEIDAAGQVYVLDRLAKHVLVFDAFSEHRYTFGRPGAGPGEFENPFGLAWDDKDNLWVVDVRLRRYSIFTPTGRHVREFQRAVGGYSWPWPGEFTHDGLLLEADYRSDAGNRIIAYSPGETLISTDTFPHPADELAAGDFWNLQDERGLGAMVPIPFGKSGHHTLTRDGFVWFGHSGSYSLMKRTLAGDTVLVVERTVSPPPVTALEREAAIEHLGDFATHPKMDLSRLPETKPYFEGLVVDEVGRLWVLREGTGNDWLFDVFDTTGEFMLTIPIPVVPETLPPPRIVGGHILIVTHNDLNVDFVVRFGLSTPLEDRQ